MTWLMEVPFGWVACLIVSALLVYTLVIFKRKQLEVAVFQEKLHHVDQHLAHVKMVYQESNELVTVLRQELKEEAENRLLVEIKNASLVETEQRLKNKEEKLNVLEAEVVRLRSTAVELETRLV